MHGAAGHQIGFARITAEAIRFALHRSFNE